MRMRLLFVLTCLTATTVLAQDSEETETLVPGDFDNGFIAAVDDKLSTIDGDFANFVGIHGGWLIDHRFLVGMGAYGTTNSPRGLELGYGGLVLEYFFNPNDLINYSVRGLIGAGGRDELNHRHFGYDYEVDAFFVAEPEARVNVNVAKPFRLGFGVGYRFVGADAPSANLGGPTFTFSFKFGIF